MKLSWIAKREVGKLYSLLNGRGIPQRKIHGTLQEMYTLLDSCNDSATDTFGHPEAAPWEMSAEELAMLPISSMGTYGELQCAMARHCEPAHADTNRCTCKNSAHME